MIEDQKQQQVIFDHQERVRKLLQRVYEEDAEFTYWMRIVEQPHAGLALADAIRQVGLDVVHSVTDLIVDAMRDAQMTINYMTAEREKLQGRVEQLSEQTEILNGQNERYRKTISEITGIFEDELQPAGEALYEQLHDHWLPRFKAEVLAGATDKPTE